MIELIDSHVHLDAEQYADDLDAVIERAQAAGITKLVTIGSSDDLHSARRAIAIAEKYEFIWATVGVHPHSAACEADINELRELALHPKVVAIGETGLDFFRDWSPVDKQYLWFESQINLALEVNKPLIIHSREAGEKCLRLLQEKGAQAVGGVFHCFSESWQFAERLRDINFLVSFPGNVTFKKAVEMQEAARNIPLEQIMIETDGPYLAPEPYRGKRCESAFMIETALFLARLRNIPIEKFADTVTANTKHFFRI